MQGEGTFKGFLGIFLAVLLVVAVAFWHQTLFILRFIGDLILINLHPLWEAIAQHFGHS